MNWDVEYDNESLDNGIVRFFLANVLQYVEGERSLLVDCFKTGIIPDIENLDHLQASSENFFTPSLLRAPKLVKSGGIQGWVVRVWPELKKFTGITGSVLKQLATYKINHVFRPSVPTEAPGYGSSEGGIAVTED
ncbi:hypothetical protein EV702DRAFT_1043770 [Suillus placidus]|uniref:Uncharacterized protein n=1 Tax=Suillus placidus TaxID=48579 RepID=A0A9P7D535_9AGAM|nr:hypothetical protein EV702DRAFT_1043770 [Suillus placidus]